MSVRSVIEDLIVHILEEMYVARDYVNYQVPSSREEEYGIFLFDMYSKFYNLYSDCCECRALIGESVEKLNKNQQSKIKFMRDYKSMRGPDHLPNLPSHAIEDILSQPSHFSEGADEECDIDEEYPL